MAPEQPPAAARAGWRRRAAAFEESLETRVGPWAAVGAIVVLLTVGSMLGWLGLGGDPFDDRAFDAEVWRASEGADFDCPRGTMLASLEAQHLRTGVPRRELIALLGPPDNIDRPDLASWYVGHWSGMRLDIDSLELSFGADGLLTKWRRPQH